MIKKICSIFVVCGLLTTTCLLNPIRAKERNQETVITITEDDFKDIDYIGINNIDNSNSTMPFIPGETLYEDYYISVPARTSVGITKIISEWKDDVFRIEWAGATSYNPQMDLVLEDTSTGTQFSLYNTYGNLMDTNAGALRFSVPRKATLKVWLRSLNYSDVTFYRVSIYDFEG